jgi:hypothetical protein
MSFRRPPPPPPTAQQTTRLNSVLAIGFARKQAEIATPSPETPWETLVFKALKNANHVMAAKFWGDESEAAVKELCYLLTNLDTRNISQTAQDDIINKLQEFLDTNKLAFWKNDAYATTAENATGENGGKPNIVDMCTMLAETIKELKAKRTESPEPPALVRQPGRRSAATMFA